MQGALELPRPQRGLKGNHAGLNSQLSSLTLLTGSSGPHYLDGVLEGAQVVPVGELDDRKLVLSFQILNPLVIDGWVAACMRHKL